MKCKVIIDREARKTLKCMERNKRERVIKKLKEIQEIDEKRNPPHRSLKKLTQVEGYRLRVGEIRIIVEINKKTKIIRVTKIEKRSRAYDNLIIFP